MGKTNNNNKVNFHRCKKKAQVAQEGRIAVWETTVSLASSADAVLYPEDWQLSLKPSR